MIRHAIQGDSVPALGLGTWQVNGEECERAVEHALEIGYRHIDTAQAYENEREVGRGLQAANVDRDEIFLTTKVWYENLSPERVRSTTEASLSRLDTPYVDLLLVHWPNDEFDLHETIDALQELRAEGKTRHIGVSNFPGYLLEEALSYADNIFCDQVEYHPYLGQEELLEMADEHDLLITAYSPLARGKVLDDEALREIAEEHGKSPAQVTLRWHVQQDRVAAIPKASSAEHRESNFDIWDFELSEEEMERIHSLASGNRIIDPDFAPAWNG